MAMPVRALGPTGPWPFYFSGALIRNLRPRISAVGPESASRAILQSNHDGMGLASRHGREGALEGRARPGRPRGGPVRAWFASGRRRRERGPGRERAGRHRTRRRCRLGAGLPPGRAGLLSRLQRTARVQSLLQRPRSGACLFKPRLPATRVVFRPRRGHVHRDAGLHGGAVPTVQGWPGLRRLLVAQRSTPAMPGGVPRCAVWRPR